MVNAKLIIGVIVLLAVIGGGVYLVQTGKISLDKEDETKIEQGFLHLLEAETLKAEGVLNIDIAAQTEAGLQTALITLGFSDSVNKKDIENVQSEGVINLSVSSEGMNLSASLEDKVIGSDFYLKVISLPTLPLAVDLESLKGQWIKISSQELTEESGYDISRFTEMLEELKIVLSSESIFNVKETLEKDEIGDHYLIALDKTAVKEIMKGFLEKSKAYVPEEQQAEVEEMIQNIPSAVDEFWAKTGGIELEVWIDNELRKLKWENEFQVDSLGQVSQGETSIGLSLEIMFSEFGEPVEVAPPEAFISLEDILTNIFSGMIKQPEE